MPPSPKVLVVYLPDPIPWEVDTEEVIDDLLDTCAAL